MIWAGSPDVSTTRLLSLWRSGPLGLHGSAQAQRRAHSHTPPETPPRFIARQYAAAHTYPHLRQRVPLPERYDRGALRTVKNVHQPCDAGLNHTEAVLRDALRVGGDVLEVFLREGGERRSE